MPERERPQDKIPELLEQLVRMEKINRVLMNRVEKCIDSSDSAFAIFGTNVLLNETIKQRTRELAGINERLLREVQERRQAEKTLGDSQKRLSGIINFLPDPTFIVDLDGIVITWNRAMTEMTGVKAEDIIGRGNYEYAIPFYGQRRPILIDMITYPQEKILEIYPELEKENETLIITTYISSLKNGCYIWAKARPLYDSDGNITGAIETIRDITVSKKNEQALKDGEELLKAIIESTEDGIIVTDENDKITYYNDRFARMWGYSREFLENADKKTLIKHAVGKLINSEEVADKNYNLHGKNDSNARIIHFKDSLVYVQYICPLIRDNKICGRVWNFRDITDSQKAEQDLRDSEARYRTLFDSAGDAIFIMKDDLFIDCNSKTLEVFGCTRNQIIGQPPYRFSPEFQPDGRDSKIKALEKINAALNGQPQFFEWTHIKYDNTPFNAEVSLNRMNIGHKVFIMAIVRDVTERKQAQEQKLKLQEELQRARRMESLGVLAGGVAHDLNNMLGPMVGYPELLLMKLPEDSPLRKQVKRIGNAARDAADVIQDLLTLARRGRYEMEPVSINTIIETYLDSPGYLELSSARHDIDVAVKLDKTPPNIHGSTPHLAKVIMNLIVNAFDAMPDGGHLEIETSHRRLARLIGGYKNMVDGDYVVLKVKDTGVGIAREDMEKIFEPYYSKKKMGTSGSGLGLSVVYGIVKDHKGYYDIISEPQKGTEFILYFPVTNKQVKTGCDDVVCSENHETVLVVDDEELQRQIAEDILASLNYRVTTVKNGHEAVEYLKNNSVDLVVMDMIMENGFDGLDAYREIIKIKPGQKAVIVSGFSATERVNEMQSLGAGPYVRKPYTRRDIARAIRETLHGTPVPSAAES
nr:PAS domain S-box protein [candidate division Zixibacteria bacterium]